MTAKIIETNATPFKTVDVDPVTVDIIETPYAMSASKWMPCFFARR